MERILCSGNLKKFSMGRSTGLRSMNWKTRFVKLTNKSFTISDNMDSAPKFSILINAISIVFHKPTSADHPEAGIANCIVIRLFDNGVFNLALQAQNAEEKETWLTGLRQATEGSKGVQHL